MNVEDLLDEGWLGSDQAPHSEIHQYLYRPPWPVTFHVQNYASRIMLVQVQYTAP
jgi:hypothetical protein